MHRRFTNHGLLGWMFALSVLCSHASADSHIDLTAGESTYKSVCQNCHGPTAKGMASFPKLTGRDIDYLVMRLEQYRAGETVGPNTALMSPLAVGLSDEDIQNVSAYIVSLNP